MTEPNSYFWPTSRHFLKKASQAVFISLLSLEIFSLQAQAAVKELSGYARVIDGDTLELNGQRIRLHGIDAPEARQFCLFEGSDYPCGTMATAWVVRMTLRKNLRCKGSQTDRYGRLIAICFLDEEDLNGKIVRAGWALAYTRYSRDYVEAQKAAARSQSGIWAGEFMEPWGWRKHRRTKKK
mgnify:CR=1 FL=1|jgi:endonuclease YncB( thermonuclease family)